MLFQSLFLASHSNPPSIASHPPYSLLCVDFFKEGFELTPLIEEHRANSVWGEFASDLMNGKFLWPKPGSHDDQAHPPIHPTKNVELADLVDPDERKIYELVTIHFLACCAQDAKGLVSVCFGLISSHLD